MNPPILRPNLGGRLLFVVLMALVLIGLFVTSVLLGTPLTLDTIAPLLILGIGIPLFVLSYNLGQWISIDQKRITVRDWFSTAAIDFTDIKTVQKITDRAHRLDGAEANASGLLAHYTEIEYIVINGDKKSLWVGERVYGPRKIKILLSVIAAHAPHASFDAKTTELR